MKLDLSEVACTLGMHATQEVDEPCPGDIGFDCTSTVKGWVRFNNTGSLLLLEGEVEAGIKFGCSRCLTSFDQPVKAAIAEEFRLVKIADAIRVLPLDEADTSADLICDNVLDVEELIRQNLLLVLPIQPLCRPDCRGLCPTCGENLNVRECTCPPAERESPFNVLADLLDEESGGS